MNAVEVAVSWAACMADRLLTEADRQGISVGELVREVGHPPRFARFLTEEPGRLTVEFVARAATLLGLDAGEVLHGALS